MTVLCFAAFLLCAILSHWVIFSNVKSSLLEKKQTEFDALANSFSTLFSESLTYQDKNFVSPLVDANRRLLVLDTSFEVIFDSSEAHSLNGQNFNLPASVSALSGKTYFECKSKKNIYESVYATPLLKNDNVRGVILIYEYDDIPVFVMRSLEGSFALSLAISLLILAIVVAIISIYLHRRVNSLVLTVKNAEGTNLDETAFPESSDEFSPIYHEFNNLYKRLDYTQKMRQAFVSDASHELRTPLAAIKLLSESITQAENIDEKTYKEFMEDIILEVDRMSHTAEKLLILSRLDNPSKAPTEAPISLTDIVYKIISYLSPIAESKNVRIETHLEDDCTIFGDMEAINQIIGNLIDNGIKYNNPNGLLRIYLFNKRGNCIFIIDDSGIGIPEEFRESIFERFFRIDASRKHDGRGGSGLGLSIVKQNVEAMGGTISVSESTIGGTRFTVVFPSM